MKRFALFAVGIVGCAVVGRAGFAWYEKADSSRLHAEMLREVYQDGRHEAQRRIRVGEPFYSAPTCSIGRIMERKYGVKPFPCPPPIGSCFISQSQVEYWRGFSDEVDRYMTHRFPPQLFKRVWQEAAQEDAKARQSNGG
jgi:hypothetical protein